MKKLLLIILTLAICAGVTACDSDEADKKETKTEYTMSELEDKLKLVIENIESDIMYLTDDEIEEGMEIIYNECKKQGLPAGQTITVRGQVSTKFISEYGLIVGLSTGSDDSKATLPCLFPLNSEISFVEENDNVIIKGDFMNGKEAKMLMENCQLVSPNVDIPKFENNVEEIVNDVINTYSDYLMDLNYFEEKEVNAIVVGKVDISTDKAKEEVSEIFFNDYKITDYIDIYDYIYEISDNDKENYIYLLCDNKDLNEGDKIFFESFLQGRFIYSNEGDRMLVIYSTYPKALYKYSE